MIQLPKRLIEVDLPIKRISAHARREKSIRHGHISTLHIWWARRPLAACRAVICASLWPDPADPLCPQSFRDRASKIIFDFAKAAAASKELGGSCDTETWIKWQALAKRGGLDSHNEAHWNILRFALLDFIADFANWDNSTVKEYLDASRALTQAAHEALGGEAGTRPLVVDPFAGGGAIPLEALRVGADVFASDLNPIPVLLNKVVLEYIPRYGKRLADEIRRWGEWIQQEAEKELAEFYPKDADGATPIAYLWARTIRCEGPGCGAEVPLMSSLWLGKKPHNSWALRLRPNQATKHVDFEVIRRPKAKEVGEGTVARGSATCVCCGYTTPSKSVRRQLSSRCGGASDARLFSVATTRPDERGRFYRVPNDRDVDVARASALRLEMLRATSSVPDLTPTELTPPGGGQGAGRAFSQRNYGMEKFEDLFTPRQLLTLLTLVAKVKEAGEQIRIRQDDGFAEAVQVCLAMNVDKMADYGSSLATWSSPASQETVRGTFSRQALSIAWDFAEAYPFASSSGGWSHNLAYLVSPIEAESGAYTTQGQVERATATQHPMPNDSIDGFITDPPYYDAIPYADLSDYFIVWLKRSLAGSPRARDFAELSPKDEECVVDETKGHDSAFFERTMGEALAEGRRIVKPSGVGVVVFAHKSTAGWEAQLQAMIEAGWMITGSWPLDTERQGRTRANSSAALASSVHLVCRPRKNVDGPIDSDQVGDWRDVLQELPRRIHEWMPRLSSEGVVGADAIFACLGPALEVFSRYSRVEKANGEAVALREYLEHVWAAVAKEALAQVFKGADATGFEPDARLTAMWLWTLKTPDTNGNADDGDDEDQAGDEQEGKKAKAGGFKLEYDAARKIAQGLGAVLETLTHLVEVKGDEARLLPVSERTRHLFGKEEEEPARAARKKASAQMNMFAELTGGDDAEMAWQQKTVKRVGETTLDRVHQAMILFAAGRGEALKRFVVDDGVGRDGKFWRLADALNALYPAGSDERRWVEGVLARKKQFGF
jgi:adenine-specific DNA methylase